MYFLQNNYYTSFYFSGKMKGSLLCHKRFLFKISNLIAMDIFVHAAAKSIDEKVCITHITSFLVYYYQKKVLYTSILFI